jgi:hypothetical protein
MQGAGTNPPPPLEDYNYRLELGTWNLELGFELGTWNWNLELEIIKI